MFNKVIYEMIGAFKINRPIFKLLHSRDFMDPNDIVYTHNFICPKIEVVRLKKNLCTRTQLLLMISIHFYMLPWTMLQCVNAKNILATSNTRYVQHPKFACIKMICVMVFHFKVLSLLRWSPMQQQIKQQHKCHMSIVSLKCSQNKSVHQKKTTMEFL